METKKLVMIIVGVAIAGLLVFSGMLIGKSNSTPTGAATTSMSSSGMSSEGFSSTEEMMEAHHGKQSASSSGGCGGVAESSSSTAEFIGQESEYGVTYDDEGYAKLVEAVTTIELSTEQTKTIVGLDVQLSCCGFKTLQESGNCQCGHHVALYGLAKLMTSKGYDSDQIQIEIDKWKEVFFPNNGAGNTGGC